jgi:hypothetical protein
MKSHRHFEFLFMQENGAEAWELYRYCADEDDPTLYKYSDAQKKYQDYLEGRYPYKEVPAHVLAKVKELKLAAQEHERAASAQRRLADEMERGMHWETVE